MIILNTLDSIKTSRVVTLPDWYGGVWECELKRPSILALAAKGAIANPLMKTARKLFYSGVSPDAGDLAEEGRVRRGRARTGRGSPRRYGQADV